MIGGREAIMTALLARLVASVKTSFTGDTVKDSITVSNLSATAGLFLGLPVFGSGMLSGATIATLDTVGKSLTLAVPAAKTASGAALVTGFQTTGRRLIPPSDVTAQPALFLRNVDDEDAWSNSVMPRTTLSVEVWIYSQGGQNPDLAPAVALNNLVDAVRAAFAPDNAMARTFTLGGLAQWCRIEGKTEYSPGDLDGQAGAMIPVKILVP